MQIPGQLTLEDGRTIDVPFLMDLGYNNQLELNTTRENNITPPAKCKEATLGRNIQGIATHGCIGRVPTVTIGGHTVSEVTCAFVSAEDSDHTLDEVMIGLGLLSRFNLVFDYAHKVLYMEPNESFGDPFEPIE